MRKKTFMATITSSMLLVLVAFGMQAALTHANPVPHPKGYNLVTIQSPQQGSLNNNYVSLNFTAKITGYELAQGHAAYCYTLDGSGSVLNGAVWDDLLKVQQRLVNSTLISDDVGPNGLVYPPYTESSIECWATLPKLSQGEHKITIYFGYSGMSQYAGYDPLGTVSFLVSGPVSVVSIENKTFDSADLPLTFVVREPLFGNSFAYSLDGQRNVSISGNTTLKGVSAGKHSIIVYAMCQIYDATSPLTSPPSLEWLSSPKTDFIVDAPLPTPTQTPSPSPTQQPTAEPSLTPIPTIEDNQKLDLTPILVLSGIVVAAVAVGAVVYFRKRKRS